MSLALTNNLAILYDRAYMFAKARAFFAERDVLEVDVPILSACASVDAHIDLIEAHCLGKPAFLHSSPEYGMKRLLAEGIGDIYQMSHVFRSDEKGERHNPEFTMVEWYRIGLSFEELIEETIAFFRLFIKTPRDFEKLTYREAFFRYAGRFPETQEERDPLFAFEIEPQLEKTVIYGFPPEQAALSRIGSDGLAKRFELFYRGVELANGYDELTDPAVQRKRLNQENQARQSLGKKAYPIDEDFLEALEKGVPDCCGVAVGFDRLMMLRHGAEKIDEVLPCM